MSVCALQKSLSSQLLRPNRTGAPLHWGFSLASALLHCGKLGFPDVILNAEAKFQLTKNALRVGRVGVGGGDSRRPIR